MREEQQHILDDLVAGLDESGWGFERPKGERPVLEVPFNDGDVVVTVAWRPASVETLPSVDGVTTGPFLRKDVAHR